MQNCDQTCGWCAKNWFTWLKTREAQMSKTMRGEATSFAAAAATSVRPPKPFDTCSCDHAVGSKASVRGRTWDCTVTGNKGYVGLDGRHWLELTSGAWTFNCPCTELA